MLHCMVVPGLSDEEFLNPNLSLVKMTILSIPIKIIFTYLVV